MVHRCKLLFYTSHMKRNEFFIAHIIHHGDQFRYWIRQIDLKMKLYTFDNSASLTLWMKFSVLLMFYCTIIWQDSLMLNLRLRFLQTPISWILRIDYHGDNKSHNKINFSWWTNKVYSTLLCSNNYITDIFTSYGKTWYCPPYSLCSMRS